MDEAATMLSKRVSKNTEVVSQEGKPHKTRLDNEDYEGESNEEDDALEEKPESKPKPYPSSPCHPQASPLLHSGIKDHSFYPQSPPASAEPHRSAGYWNIDLRHQPTTFFQYMQPAQQTLRKLAVAKNHPRLPTPESRIISSGW